MLMPICRSVYETDYDVEFGVWFRQVLGTRFAEPAVNRYEDYAGSSWIASSGLDIVVENTFEEVQLYELRNGILHRSRKLGDRPYSRDSTCFLNDHLYILNAAGTGLIEYSSE